DKDFGKQTLHKGHANPLAEVTTSLKTYQHFTLEKAYLGEDFFWAFTPGTSCSTPLWRCCLLTTSRLFHNGIAEGEVDPTFGPLEALRLSVITDCPVWVILSEIFIKKAE
ncbi:unnamed protein product, partial [Coregonus sp. 'balchen']